MLFALYTGLWRAAEPLLRRHTRLRDSFAARSDPEAGPFAAFAAASRAGENADAASPLSFWIQAASAGEARLCRSLIPALYAAAYAVPDATPEAACPPSRPLRLLCTSCTAQGLAVLEETRRSLPEAARLNCFCGYLPFDRPDLMREVLRLAAPGALILLETELWPGLMRAAKDLGVPLLVVNGRMSAKSARLYGLTRFFWRDLAPDGIAAISEADANRFAAVFGHPDTVKVMSNIKFDLLWAEEKAPVGAARPEKDAIDEGASRRLRAELGLGDADLLLLLASVRAEEEDLLLPLVRSLHGQKISGRNTLVAVAPRHMHRIRPWEEKLRAAGLSFQLRQSGADAAGQISAQAQARDCGKDALGSGQPNPPPLCLCDRFGELAALYAAADSVFVGGSLVPLGGQNFLEAIAAGASALVGPHLDNFLWAGEEVFKAGLARKIAGPSELEEALLEGLRDRAAQLERAGPDGAGRARAALLAERRAQFQTLIGAKVGGSALAAAMILNIVDSGVFAAKKLR
jgi:3-deoxy-D-manno-octulosonic-acid transferase